ncbi:MAG TPA: DUF2393 domain-containing protein [Nautiliaceae bacterium]|nr:DUF2393 domain-containing protein [Nautiliaceae bacterium]
MIPYFTILHWLDILFFLVLFIFLVTLSVKASNNTKILLSMILASFLVTAFGAVLGLIILEKYTKKAKILNLTKRRVLLNETLVLKGRVKNIGKFKINYCKLEIKLVNINNELNGKTQKGVFFKSGGLNIFGSKDKRKKRPNIVKATKVIIKDGLLPGEIKNFSAVIPYPPYFKNTYLTYKLYCH